MKLHMTIARKIQLCVVVMILFTVVLIVSASFPRFEKTIAETTENHLMDQVTTESEKVNSTIKDYYYILKSFADNKNLMIQIVKGNVNLFESDLGEICQNEQYIDQIAILDTQGQILLCKSDGDIGEITYQTEKAVQEVLNEGKEYSLSGVMNAGSGNETVMLVVPVIGPDETLLGALAGSISCGVFEEQIKQCEVTGLQNLSAYVLDNNGIFISHSDENKVGTQVQNSVLQNVVERIKNGETVEKEGTSYNYKGIDKFAAYYVIPDKQWIVCMAVDESEIINPIREVECKAYIISIVQCILACVITILLTSFIVRPIRVTNQVLNQLAEYHFQIDESYSKYTKNKDETGEMCNSIYTVVNSLRDEMSQINSVSEELTSTANSLKKIAQSVTQSSENNRNLMEDMTGSFDSIKNAAADIGQYINDVRESANEMSTRADESVNKAQSLVERAENIKETATNANQQSVNVFDNARKTMEVAIKKAESVEKIGMFTDTIMSISSKTKLLALNASIEAANAGSHGKGFAVVADQIGVLAAQSAKSADSIGELVNEIYQAVSGMKDCLEQILSYIETNVMPDYEKFSEASEGYSQDAGKMIETMQFLKNEIYKFSIAMDNSVEKVGQINTNILDSSEKMHSMSEENASVGDQIQETYEMIQGNSSLSVKLKEIVGKFTI